MRSVDLSKLPKRGKCGQVSWKKCVGCSVGFEYDGIIGVFNIINYDHKTGRITLSYCNQEKIIFVSEFKNCKISFVKDFYNNCFGNCVPTTRWTEQEINILKEKYSDMKTEDLSKLLPHRTKESIATMARREGLSKSDDYIKKIRMNNLKYKVGLDEKYTSNNYDIDFLYVFKKYKSVLKGNRVIIGDNNLNREKVILLFKYYIKTNNIKHNRDFWLNCIIGDILTKSKLKNRVKDIFDGYYDFITHCFPKYKFKEWEFKYLNVSDDFWNNKFNRFCCIRNSLNEMTKNKIIKQNHDCLYFDFHFLNELFHPSLITYYGKGCIIEYLKFINYDIPTNLKYYEGIYFDSVEERNVYEFISENFNVKINKCDRCFKFLNTKSDERYIPDFIITEINDSKIDKNIIVEYFGMYKDSMNTGYFGEYKRKTDRKIAFYENNNDIYFIPLFPADIINNFKGVRNKLTSFIMQLKLERG